MAHSSIMQPFLFEGMATVRVVVEADKPLFVARDVCDVLGIVWKGSDSTGPLGALDDDEKGVRTLDTAGGRQELAVVSESGLYAMIFRSRKERAKRFRRWVTEEVLPSIRRTGGYAASASAPAAHHGEIIPPGGDGRRFPEWTTDELRTRRGIVDMYRLTFGGAAAQWIMPQLGFPVPPPQLIERRRQLDLFGITETHKPD